MADARARLGKQAQIGVAAKDSRHLAMEAGEAGADYVSFGAFFPSTTKEVSTFADLDLLHWWSNLFELPVVAIGGITPDNCVPLVAAGADFLATCAAVWSGDEAQAVADFTKAIASGSQFRAG